MKQKRLFISIASLSTLAVLVALELTSGAQTSVPGFYAERNVNMVSGTKLPGEANAQRAALGGDPYLQRQNEPSIAPSTRNPMHLLAGANDYRTVDMAIDSQSQGDVWLGLFKSFDGGQTWQSTLLPGFPQALTAQEGNTSPIHGYAAASDPTVRAGANGMFFYSGIAFNRGTGALGVVFVSRFIDLNNREGAFFNVPANQDPIKYIDTTVIDSGTAGQFEDKPGLAVDIPRSKATTTNLLINDTDASGNPIQVPQSFACGNAYLAYTDFTGNTIPNIRSKVLLSRSTDCGATWGKPVMIDQSYSISQGPAVAIDPNSGAVYVAWRVFASSSTPDSIVVAKSTNGGSTFSKGAVVANIYPVDLATRPAFSGDPFLSFRTDTFPTMAVDNNGRIYVAWTQRGYWGNDNQPQDGIPDGSRIVISSSTDGTTWSSPAAADNSAQDASGKPTGYQIMPALSFAAGRLMLLYYDFRDDFYPNLFNMTVPLTDASGNPLGLVPYDPSLPLADPLAFDPIPVRHTVDVRVAFATGSPATFGGSSLKVSSYPSSIVPNTSGGFSTIQLQSNAVNLPMFDGGTSPFMGDYVEIAAASQVVPDLNNPGKWVFNTSSANSPVFHAVWADNRNVVTPPPQLTSSGLSRTDWTQYSPPGTCSPGTSPGMRNQDIYTSRLSQGLVMGSYGNAKPLNIERAFSIFVANTTPEAAPVQGSSFIPTSRYFRLTIVPPTGVAASFNPLSNPSILTSDVAVPNRGRVAVTLFARASGSTNPKTALLVTAQEIAGIGGSLISGGLQSSLVLNPDPTNPTPLNVDSLSNALASTETHDPQFVSFNCGDFASLSGSGVVNNCQGTFTQVTPLIVAWPSLVSPLNPGQLNPALLNPALLNPALLNPALLNPALLNPALLNPALLNPALLNPALLNPALLNPALLNPALLNPALLNPALLNTALLNPALLNPALLNPALLNPALLNPALLNPAPAGADLTSTAFSPSLIQGGVLDPSVTPTTLTDVIWQVQNIGNDVSSYFFTWLSAIVSQQPAQLLIYRTYKTPLADSNCALTQNGLHYEFLANILNPALLTPAQLNAAVTFSLAPNDQVFVALRFLSSGGQPSGQALSAFQIAGGALPQAPNTGALPATATFITASPNPVIFGQALTLAASAVSPGVNPANGSVTFSDGSTILGVASLNTSGQASLTTSTLSAGTHAITAAYSGNSSFKGSTSQPLTVTVNPATPTVVVTGGTFTYDGTAHAASAATIGIGTGSVAGSISFSYAPGGSSAPVNAGTYAVTATFTSGDANYTIATGTGSITINPATPNVSVTGGPFTYDGNSHSASASATGVGGASVSGSFALTYSPGGTSTPVNAGRYSVSASFASSDPNYTNATGSGSITIGQANPIVSVTGGVFVFDGNPHPASATANGAGGIVSGTFSFTYTPGGSSAPVNAGSYAVAAVFTSLNANYTNATGLGSITITPAAPILSSLTAPTIVFGQTPTVLAGTIRAGSLAPAGSVSITLNGVTQPAAIDAATGNFTASFATGQLAVAGSPFSITYYYAGSLNFAAAGPDTSKFLTVNKDASSTILLAAANPIVIGQQATLIATTAAVAPGSGVPTGIVTFFDGVTAIGIGTLSSTGQAAISTSALVAGPHTLTAVYQGDPNFASSTSPSVTLNVIYSFNGFLSPLGPANTSTVFGPFNLGKTVPVKWQLLNAGGSYISDLSTVVSLQAAAAQACGDVNGTNPFLLYPSATGSTNLRYDTTNNQFIFNWDTTGRASGCTYNLSLTLNDGITRYAFVLIQ